MECPDTWFVPRGPNGECECGYSFDGVVSCDEGTKESQSVRLLTSNKTVVGECLFNCLNVSKSYYNYMYHPVPRNLVGGDNNSVCGYLHRKRTLCGQCVHDYYRAVYSYTFHCIIYCEESQWLLYIWLPMSH